MKTDIDRAEAEVEACQAAILVEVTQIQMRLARLERLRRRRGSI